jgi:hypothetical protein
MIDYINELFSVVCFPLVVITSGIIGMNFSKQHANAAGWDGIKMDLGEIGWVGGGGVEWIHLPQDRLLRMR